MHEFIERNKTVPVFKGAWNYDFSKLTYWLEDGSKITLSCKQVSEIEKVNWRLESCKQ